MLKILKITIWAMPYFGMGVGVALLGIEGPKKWGLMLLLGIFYNVLEGIRNECKDPVKVAMDELDEKLGP